MAFCHSCGHKNPDEAQFCMKCGADVSTPQQSQPTSAEDSQTPKPSPAQTAPGPKKSHTLRNILFVILALAVIGAIVGATQGDKDSGETATTTASAAPATTRQTPTTRTPTTAAPEPLYLGDVSEGHGCLVSAVTLEDPANPGVLYDAEVGTRLIAVEIIVGNVSAAALSVNPLNATLIDSEGFTYQPELAGRDGQLGLVDLAPGEKIRGWVAFEIDENATPARIKYALDYFGSEVLQAQLEAPPEGHVENIGARRLHTIMECLLEDLLFEATEKTGASIRLTAAEVKKRLANIVEDRDLSKYIL